VHLHHLEHGVAPTIKLGVKIGDIYYGGATAHGLDLDRVILDDTVGDHVAPISSSSGELNDGPEHEINREHAH